MRGLRELRNPSRVLASAPPIGYGSKPARGDKPSKAPLYAEAQRRYLTDEAPNLTQIAIDCGLRPDAVIECAERQKWANRRAIQLRDTSATRPASAEIVDAQLVAATVHHVQTFTAGWQDLAVKVVALPTEPDSTAFPEAEADKRQREHTRLLARKVDLMRQVSQGVREMTEAAMVLGLAKAPTKDGPQDGKLDLSKLTQLNVTINAALERPEPKLALPVSEAPNDPQADGGF